MRRRHLSLTLMLALFAMLAFGEIVGHGNASKLSRAPAGNLDVSFHSYLGKGHEEMPVQVLIFDVNVHRRSMWVREWRLKNRSSKTVTGIRPALFVYRQQEPDVLLLRHQIFSHYGTKLAPGVEWPGGPCSPVAKHCRSSFAMLSVEELLKPTVSTGKPEGIYRIALGIDKVWFEDGTVWEFEGS